MIEQSINELMGSMSQEELRHYVDQVYSVLKATDMKALDDSGKKDLHHLFFSLPKLIRDKALGGETHGSD